MKTFLTLTAAAMILCTGTMLLRTAYPTVRAASSPNAATSSAVVVELFTSEGCSSCPPADDLLRSIANTNSTDGQPIVALSEHVTYWNNLGWADPFSSDTFTARQNRYSDRLRLDEVYTPQMVVNGHLQFVGNNRDALVRALHAESGRTTLPLTITGVHRLGDTLAVQVRSGDLPAHGPAELWAAVTDDADQSEVARGENSGRTLRHAAVLRSLVRVGSVSNAGQQTFQVPLPPIVAHASQQPHHLALLAQSPEQGTILGATLMPF